MKEKILEKYNAFKVRNANYYKKAFLKITFNGAAFLFGTNWMLYRRMWFSAITYVIVSGILFSAVKIICQNDGLDPTNYTALAFLCMRLIIGYFSNSLYRVELKWKMRQGYHQSKDFSPTSLRSMVFVSVILVVTRFLLVGCFIPSLEAKIKEMPFGLADSLVTLSIYVVACLYEYRTYKNAAPKKDDINQYLDKDGNDMSIIGAVACYFTLIVLISICSIVAMRLVSKKITNQLNSIAENIDKMDANGKSIETTAKEITS